MRARVRSGAGPRGLRTSRHGELHPFPFRLHPDPNTRLRHRHSHSFPDARPAHSHADDHPLPVAHGWHAYPEHSLSHAHSGNALADSRRRVESHGTNRHTLHADPLAYPGHERAVITSAFDLKNPPFAWRLL